MAEMYAVSGETLTGIADAIRSKSKSDDFMTVASMASAIEALDGHATYLGELVGRTAAGSQYGEIEIPLPDSNSGSCHARIAVSTEAPNASGVNFILVASRAIGTTGNSHAAFIVVRTGIAAVYFSYDDASTRNTGVIAGTNTRPYSENTRFKYYEIL